VILQVLKGFNTKSNEGIKKETETILNDFEDILSKFSLLQYQQQVIKLLTFAIILVAIIIIFFHSL